MEIGVATQTLVVSGSDVSELIMSASEVQYILGISISNIGITGLSALFTDENENELFSKIMPTNDTKFINIEFNPINGFAVNASTGLEITIWTSNSGR